MPTSKEQLSSRSKANEIVAKSKYGINYQHIVTVSAVTTQLTDVPSAAPGLQSTRVMTGIMLTAVVTINTG